jgi:16S rRNA (guanine527-N7)-methyltransferase
MFHVKHSSDSDPQGGETAASIGDSGPLAEQFAPEIEPAVAAQIFGEGIDKARAYAAALIRDGDTLGLLGPREMPKIWTRHILNSAVVAELIEPGQKVADVGSGAGLPGIPMAIAQPGAEFVLIEPMERRANWLVEQVAALDLKNVRVMRARAEDVGEAFDVVTARALSALPKLLRQCVPMTLNGGQIIALKGSRAADEIEEAKSLQKKLRIASFEIVLTGAELLAEPTLVVRTRLV